MPDDYDDYLQVTGPLAVRSVDRRSSVFLSPTRKRERGKHRRKRGFKEAFLDMFKLDRGRFDVNLVTRDDEWYLEIVSRLTGRRYYQRCEVLCDIVGVELDDLGVTGVNVDLKV